MDMSAQVSRMCQSAYFQLHNIVKIRHCLTVNACKTIVHALVTSKLDYGNAVLFGINEPNKILTRFNKIAIQGAPQMAVDKEAISLSRVYSYYPKCNLPLFYV